MRISTLGQAKLESTIFDTVAALAGGLCWTVPLVYTRLAAAAVAVVTGQKRHWALAIDTGHGPAATAT